LKFSKEVKTGLLALVAILLLIFGYSFLKGRNLLDNDRTFYAVYDNVEGLAPSSSVTINGLEVGKVVAIDFFGREGKLLVTFKVSNDFAFSKQSVAQIYGGGLIGGKSLAILPEYEQGNMAQSGDTLPSNVEEGIMELVNERLTPLQKKVESAITDADSVLTAVVDVLDKDTRRNLRVAVADISTMASEFKNASQELNGLISKNSPKLDRTFSNLDEMSGNFNKLSDSLARLELSPMIEKLENAITDFETVASRLEKGEGTAGKLLKDEKMYDNLEGATRQLEQLLQDIKLNPKRYIHFSVFGKRPGPYAPPLDSLR